MKVSSDDDGVIWKETEPVSWGSGKFDEPYARKRLALQRGTIVSLEQELRKMMRLRGDVVRALVLLNEDRSGEARAKLGEVLGEWPST